MASTSKAAAIAAKPVAPYIGGKRNLARRIVELIERIPHKTYAEPFLGMGGVFLRRRSAARAEIVNDLSRDVSNLFRVVQAHPAALTDCVRLQLTSRAEFERQTAVDPSTLTDVQRAARFIYLQRTAFGGKVVGRNFAMDPVKPDRFNAGDVIPAVEALHERLKGVAIESLPWAAFLDRYDTPATLFYVDPPYHGSEHYYGPALFDREQFGQLADRLARLKGRFVLSINDTPETRKLFPRFMVHKVGTTYRISGEAQAARELVITDGRSRTISRRA